MGLNDGLIAKYMVNNLVWIPEKGLGYYPVQDKNMQYDKNYFNDYVEKANTEIGRALNDARFALVSKYVPTLDVVDIGIGSGKFVDSHPLIWGYDVNPVGIQWLKERGKFYDPYTMSKPYAMTFWDSLEHIKDIEAIIRRADSYVFVSMPIYEDAAHCLKSKHFKPNEHVWYFTDWGLRLWFEEQGFDCLETNYDETNIGREGINSYVFRRKRIDI